MARHHPFNLINVSHCCTALPFPHLVQSAATPAANRKQPQKCTPACAASHLGLQGVEASIPKPEAAEDLVDMPVFDDPMALQDHSPAPFGLRAATLQRVRPCSIAFYMLDFQGPGHRPWPAHCSISLQLAMGLAALPSMAAPVSPQDAALVDDLEDEGGEEAPAPALLHTSLAPMVLQVMHVVHTMGFTGHTADVAATLELLLGKASPVETAVLPEMCKPFTLTPVGREMLAAAQMDLAQLQQREEQLRELQALQDHIEGIAARVDAASTEESELDHQGLCKDAAALEKGLALIATRAEVIRACPTTAAACEGYRAAASKWLSTLDTVASNTWEAALLGTVTQSGTVVTSTAASFRAGISKWTQLIAARGTVFDAIAKGNPAAEQAEGDQGSQFSTDLARRQGWNELLEALFTWQAAADPAHPDALHLLAAAGRQVQALTDLITSHADPAWAYYKESLQAISTSVTSQMSDSAAVAFDSFMEALVGTDASFQGSDDLLHFFPVALSSDGFLQEGPKSAEETAALVAISNHQPLMADNPPTIVLEKLLGHTAMANQLHALSSMSLAQQACAACYAETIYVQKRLAEGSMPRVFMLLLTKADEAVTAAAAAAEMVDEDPCMASLSVWRLNHNGIA